MNAIFEEILSDYLDERLTPEERIEIERRLALEPELRSACDALRAVRHAVQELPTVEPTTDWTESVLHRAADREGLQPAVDQVRPAHTVLPWDLPRRAPGRRHHGVFGRSRRWRGPCSSGWFGFVRRAQIAVWPKRRSPHAFSRNLAANWQPQKMPPLPPHRSRRRQNRQPKRSSIERHRAMQRRRLEIPERLVDWFLESDRDQQCSIVIVSAMSP